MSPTAEVDVRADRISISSNDSDAALRALLRNFPQAQDIEVTAIGLEDAFRSLTGQDDEGQA